MTTEHLTPQALADLRELVEDEASPIVDLETRDALALLDEVDRLTGALSRCQSLVLQIHRRENQARMQKDQQRGIVSTLAGREAYVWHEVRRRLTTAINGGPDAAVIDVSAFHLDHEASELVCNRCGERRPKSAHGLMQLQAHTHKEN